MDGSSSDRVRQLLVDLVRLPSHPGVDRQERAVAERLSQALASSRLGVELIEVAPGRPNLLARLETDSPGPHLALIGHSDTVPPNSGDRGVGFSGEIKDGTILGRGAVDMKGALAAMAEAMLRLAAAPPARGTITFAALIDEEMESLGAEALIASGFRADGAVIGEPTENRIALGHKGLEWLELTFEGRATHGGTPQRGINAIDAAAQFIALVETELRPALQRRVHPLLGPPTINIGTIHGGDQPSTVAARAVLQLDRRTVPGESYESVLAELRTLCGAVEATRPGLRCTIKRVPGGMATLEHLSSVIEAEHPLVRAAAAAVGELDLTNCFPAWTDAGLISGHSRIPCVVLGPGDLSLAHSPSESLPLSQLDAAVGIYERLAREFCGS